MNKIPLFVSIAVVCLVISGFLSSCVCSSNVPGIPYGMPQIALLSPLNASTLDTETVTLTWEATPGQSLSQSNRSNAAITNFSVYFAKQADAYGLPLLVSEKSTQKTNLEYDTTYKWFVMAIQSDGKKTRSAEWTFLIAEGDVTAPAIAQKTPANGVTAQSTTVALTWEATAGQQSTQSARALPTLIGYDVYFAPFGEPYGVAQRSTETSTQKGNLAYNTMYKWQVVALQSNGKMATSTEWVFTTVAEQFATPQISLTFPAVNATNQSTQVTLTWVATAGSHTNTESRAAELTGYFVYFAKSAESYGAPQWVTIKQLQKSNLEYNTQYKWCVQALQSDGKTATSTERTFSTGSSTQYGSPQISLTSPASGATNQATLVVLTWDATAGSQTTAGERAVTLTGYYVYFAKSAESFGAPQWVTTKQMQKSSLDYNTTYIWRVEALQSDGKTASTTQQSFTTAELYGAPQISLLTPGNGSTNQATQVILTWEATAGGQTNPGKRANTLTGYNVYIAKSNQSYTALQWTSEPHLQATNLQHNTVYKWQVVALQSDDKRATSTEWTFTTQATEFTAPMIALESPTNGSTDQATTLTFTWQATPGDQTNSEKRSTASLTGYHFYLTKQLGTYGYPTHLDNSANHENTVSNLDYGTRYWWKVVVLQADGQEATSTEWNFVTLPQITVQSSPSIGGNVRINYEPWGGNQSSSFASGTSVTIEASPAFGYGFDGWYLGSTRVATTTEYTVTLHGNETFKANFIKYTMFHMGNTRNDVEPGNTGTMQLRTDAADEKPVHLVAFSYTFYIGESEVTFDEYDLYCEETGIPTPTDHGLGRGTKPVSGVNWFDAIGYCNWLSGKEGYVLAYDATGNLLDTEGQITKDITKVEGFRLPTEAEWEYAARGGPEDITNGFEFNDYAYAGSNTLADVGVYMISGEEGNATEPVKGKAPNEWGLYDMSGNVSEWCHDWYGSDYYSVFPALNPIGPDESNDKEITTVRVIRGGGAESVDWDCRVASRDFEHPDVNDSFSLIGFRIARTILQ